MAYHVMVCEGTWPVQPIALEPALLDNWMLGRRITESVPQPLIYTFDVDYPGTPKAMYDEKAIPVMREDVILALEGAGVDNLQYFDAVLRDPSTGNEYWSYKAFNVVGAVACADMAASELINTPTSTMTDIDFHALVVDESKARGLLLFRLGEAVSAIIVHDRVKQAIEDAGIPGFMFYGPGEWAG